MPGFDINPVEATVGQPPVNPAAQIGQIASTIGQLQENRLFPLRQQILSTQSQTLQQELQTRKIAALQGALAQTTDPSEVPSVVGRFVSAGLIDPDTAANALGGNIASLSPETIAGLREQAITAQGNAAELAADRGTTSQINTGPSIETLNTKIAPGGATTVTQAGGSAGSVPLAPGPEFGAGYLPIKRSDGSVINVPRNTVENVATGQGLPNVPGPDGQPLTGPHGEILGALPAGKEGALASVQQNQADRSNVLQTAFEGSAQRKALAEEMLQANGEFRSGPGAAKWGNIVSEANRIFNTNFAADPTTAQQVAGKIAAMLAAQQRDTLGLPATNAGEAAAEIASPNTAYSAGAIQTLAGQLAGNEDLIQKKQAAWTKYSELPNGQPRPGATYNGFVQQFNRAYDPRFFWDQYIPAQQKAEAGMTPAQKAAYEKREQQAMGLKF